MVKSPSAPKPISISTTSTSFVDMSVTSCASSSDDTDEAMMCSSHHSHPSSSDANSTTSLEPLMQLSGTCITSPTRPVRKRLSQCEQIPSHKRRWELVSECYEIETDDELDKIRPIRPELLQQLSPAEKITHVQQQSVFARQVQHYRRSLTIRKKIAKMDASASPTEMMVQMEDFLATTCRLLEDDMASIDRFQRIWVTHRFSGKPETTSSDASADSVNHPIAAATTQPLTPRSAQSCTDADQVTSSSEHAAVYTPTVAPEQRRRPTSDEIMCSRKSAFSLYHHKHKRPAGTSDTTPPRQ